MDADLFSITTKISSIIYIVATCLEGGFTLLSIIKYFSLGYTAQSKIKFTEVRLLCKFILLNLFRLRMGNEISFTILGMSNICFRVGSTATEPKTARPGLGWQEPDLKPLTPSRAKETETKPKTFRPEPGWQEPDLKLLVPGQDFTFDPVYHAFQLQNPFEKAFQENKLNFPNIIFSYFLYNFCGSIDSKYL